MRFLRRKDILHRALVVGLCLALVAAAAAQRRSRRNKGPRALALVEWPAKGGSPRLVPVTILIDGRYYDASIYKADPVPMALEPGNVYEVEQSGESKGIVTLTAARQAANGAWLADARFQSTEQLAAAHQRRSAPKAAEVVEGPPKLRRGPPSTEPMPQEPSPGRQSRGPDEPPVLRNPAPANPPPAPTASSQPPQSKPSETPDHPILRRGRPSAEQAENLPGNTEKIAPPRTSAATAKGAASLKATGAGKVLTAISDADGPEPSSFALPWKAEDREKSKAGMMQLAAAALQDYARTHGGTHPGELQDAQLRAFDLSTSNEPIFVLMALAREAPPPIRRKARATRAKAAVPGSSASLGLTFWITVAARENYDGRLRKLKAWATDSKHLDAYPRAELIDAVDADGDGRGELLFREISDIGQSFVLYRAAPDSLTELYNSAELER